jgi:hypothetical protein
MEDKMKMTMICFALVLMLSPLLEAQELTPFRSVRIGPSIDFNLALDISTYHVGNTKNNARPGSAFGILAEIPVQQSSSIKASLQYLTLSFDDENTKIDNGNQNLGWMMITRGSFSYISLRAMYQYRSLIIGAQTGLPVRAHVENCHAEPPVVPATQLVTSARDASWLVSILAGTDFSVLDTKSGELHATFLAEYPFSRMLNASVNTRPRLDDNFRLPNIAVSLAWLFAL